MKRQWLLAFAGIAAALSPLSALGFEPADMRKSVIETPVKSMLSPPSWVPRRPAPKALLTEKVIAVKNGVEKVEPGAVQWSKDFADACAKSSKSDKPVLLFAMLGNLDDKFC